MSKENLNGDIIAGENLLPNNDHNGDVKICRSPRKGEAFELTTDVGILETLAERRQRKHSHYVVYCTTFIMSIGFSIILTGVWPYLKQLDPTASKEYLGWVIAANPIGQMVFSPILGWWTNKINSTRIPFIVTIILSIIGSAMYALLPLIKIFSGYMIFVSRFIVGLSGANIAICRSYIVASTKLKERTSALAAVAAAQAIGFILGPIMQSGVGCAFQGGNFSDVTTSNENSVVLLYNGIPWNMYSVVGYICVFLGSINLLLYSPCIFSDIDMGLREAGSYELEDIKPDYCAIAALLYSFFVVGFLFVLLESILVPLVIDLYALDYKTAVVTVGIGLSVLGLFAFFIFIIVAVISRKLQNDKFLYLFFGCIPMTLGMLLHIPVGSNYPIIMDCGESNMNGSLAHTTESLFSFHNSSTNTTCNSLGCPYYQSWCYNTPIIEKPQLVVAQLVTLLGYAVAFSLAPPLFSKMLGPQPQGFWMGILTTVGGSARIVGPLFAVYIYSNLGTQWLFGLLFSLFVFTTFVVGIFYKTLVPYEIPPSGIGQLTIR